jgi:hypothetical protein
LIVAKNFTAAVRFIRDKIGVLPPSHSYDTAQEMVRWGPDATLRAGAGTQRERAELLKAMLTSMGASAKVVAAARPASLDAAAIYRTRPPQPSIDPAKLQALSPELRGQLAHVNDAASEPDADGVLSSLLALLPAGKAVAADPFDGMSPQVPVVEYTVDGATKWAFALGAIDETASAPAGLAPLSPPFYPVVSVRLMAAVADLPGVPTVPGLVELAAGRWTVDQIAGSRLLISTGSANPKATLGAPVDQITVRSPVIQVRRPTPLADPSDAALWSPSKGSAAPNAAVGAPFTLWGARFQRPAEAPDAVVGPYGTLVQLDDAGHEAALASVASLAVSVAGNAFPDIQLGISALDGNGNIVPGLIATDFSIKDDGGQQYPTLLSNAAGPEPKVMLAYDCSGSIEWPTPADKSAFDARLATAFATAAASSGYRLGVAPLGSGPDGYLVPDPPKIQSAVSRCVSESPIWWAIANQVPKDGVSALVIVSDFRGDDDPTAIPALKKRAAATGVPVALVPVSTTIDQSLIEELVQTLGAVVLDHTATDFQLKLTEFLSSTVKRLKTSIYRVSYYIAADQRTNESSRSVEVGLSARPAISATATYHPPPPSSRGQIGIAGLYVELGIAGQVSVRRIGGAQIDRFGNPVAATSADYEETRALLDGVTTIAFEPGSPTSSQNMEDLLRATLSVEPLANALAKTPQDPNEILAFGGALEYYNSAVSFMVDGQRARASAFAVAPEWLRVIIATEFVANGQLKCNSDIVPEANRSVAASTDGAAAFRDVLRSTIALSLREGIAMQSSAARLLASAPLQCLPSAADPKTLSNFTTTDLSRWRFLFDQYGADHIFVPSDPSIPGAWVVDARTGTAVAVFIDGSGGAATCNDISNNAIAQAVLNIIQICAAAIAFECKQGMVGAQCIGANTAGSVAAALAAFVGIVLTGVSSPAAAVVDGALVMVAILNWGLPGPVGFSITLLAALWSLWSIGHSGICS